MLLESKFLWKAKDLDLIGVWKQKKNFGFKSFKTDLTPKLLFQMSVPTAYTWTLYKKEDIIFNNFV